MLGLKPNDKISALSVLLSPERKIHDGNQDAMPLFF